MRRTPLKRSAAPLRRTPLRTRRRKPDYDAAAWREGLGPCVVTGATVDVDPHHALYAQVLRRHGFHAYLADHRNRVPVVRELHLKHHSGSSWRIPRSLLPASVFEFADELGLGRYIDKVYGEAVAG